MVVHIHAWVCLLGWVGAPSAVESRGLEDTGHTDVQGLDIAAEFVQEHQRTSAAYRGTLRLVNSAASAVEHAGRVAVGSQCYRGIVDLAYRIEAHGYAASVRLTKQIASG
jgi:hypothetical protein